MPSVPNRNRVVGGRVLVRRRVDADRDGDQVGQQQGGEGDHDGEREAFADHFPHRPAVLVGVAQVAAQEPAEPLQVLHVHRLVEPVPFPQRRQHAPAHVVAILLQLVRVGGDEIARRQLDDGEADDADQPKQQDHVRASTNDV